MLTIAIIISLVLSFSMHQTTVMYDEAHAVTQSFIELRKSSYDLQIASDYLTEQIRRFAVTGDRTYLDNYFEEAEVTHRRDKALAKLEEHRGKTVAFHNLKNAMAESLDLMNLEYYAARLTIAADGQSVSEYPEAIRKVKLTRADEALSEGEKRAAAEVLLFGEAYREKKRLISEHMSTCLEELEAEMHKEQLAVSGKLKDQVFIEHLLTLLLIAIMLGLVLLTSWFIILPLQKCVELIRDEKDIPLKGVYEIQFLAKTYNLMHHTNLQNKERLTYEATHDKLTGLYNRRGFDFLMKNVELETSALMLFDLDRFKQVNDSFGHDVGDKVLIRAADTIFGNFRGQDYICRIGGDELAVIMMRTDSTLTELLRRKVEKINERLATAEENGVPSVSVSVGVAFGDDGVNGETLMKQADEALYEAKEGGRSDVCFYVKKKA